MWKSVQVSTVLDVLCFNHDVAVSTAGRGCHDVLVKGKWNEYYQCH